MKKTIKTKFELRIKKNKKGQYFSINVNSIMNTNRFVYHKLKKEFVEIVRQKLFFVDKMGKISIAYYIIPANNRKFDIMNFIGAFDKFFLDALVELKIIEDDNYNIVSYHRQPVVIEIDKTLDYHNIEVEIKEC